MSYTAAADQLSAAAREEMPTLIATARNLRASHPDRDLALADLTTRLMQLPSTGVAAIAADALLRLTEEGR